MAAIFDLTKELKGVESIEEAERIGEAGRAGENAYKLSEDALLALKTEEKFNNMRSTFQATSEAEQAEETADLASEAAMTVGEEGGTVAPRTPSTGGDTPPQQFNLFSTNSTLQTGLRNEEGVNEIANCDANLQKMLQNSGITGELTSEQSEIITKNALVLKPYLKQDPEIFNEIFKLNERGQGIEGVDYGFVKRLVNMKPADTERFLNEFGANKLPHSDISSLLEKFPKAESGPEMIEKAENFNTGRSRFNASNVEGVINKFKNVKNLDSFKPKGNPLELDKYLNALKQSDAFKGLNAGDTTFFGKIKKASGIQRNIDKAINDANEAEKLTLYNRAGQAILKAKGDGSWGKFAIQTILGIGIPVTVVGVGLDIGKNYLDARTNPAAAANQLAPNQPDPAKIKDQGVLAPFKCKNVYDNNNKPELTIGDIGEACGISLFQKTRKGGNKELQCSPSPPGPFPINDSTFKFKSCEECVEEYVDDGSFFDFGKDAGKIDSATSICRTMNDTLNNPLDEYNFKFWIMLGGSILPFVIAVNFYNSEKRKVLGSIIMLLISIILSFLSILFYGYGSDTKKAMDIIKKLDIKVGSPYSSSQIDQIQNEIENSFTISDIFDFSKIKEILSNPPSAWNGGWLGFSYISIIVYLLFLGIIIGSYIFGGKNKESTGKGNEGSDTRAIDRGTGIDIEFTINEGGGEAGGVINPMSQDNDEDDKESVDPRRHRMEGGGKNKSIKMGGYRSQKGGGIKKDLKILSKTIKKFNRWLIILLLIFAIIINYFYQNNKINLNRINYLQEINKKKKNINNENNENNKTKHQNFNYIPSVVFGGQLIN